MKRATKTITIEVLTQAFTNFGREMRDFMRQEIGASETRLKKEMTELKTEILDGVTDIVNNGIHPQLDDREHRLLKLETKAQH